MMHRTVASVFAPDRDAAAAAVGSAADADLVEVRLDALWSGRPDADAATEDLVAIVAAGEGAQVDLLATLRPRRQGGAFDGDEQVRLGLLAAAAAAGFAFLDVEADHTDNEATVKALRDHGARLIASDHSLPTAPGRDDGLLRLLAMHDLRTDAEKLAFPTGSFMDTLRAIELVHAHAERHGRPAVAPVGADARVRALLAVAGNRLTYGHPPGGRPAVPGQPALADIQAAWRHWGLGGDDLGPAGGQAWLAVLGGSVGPSLSPRIHNAALRSVGRPERYVSLDVPDSLGAMRLLATVAPRIGLAGASVTAPLKVHAHDIAACDEAASAIGAANCLRFGPDGAEATNTDAAAVQRIVEPHRTATPDAVVLGAGGAARAALFALGRLGIDARFTSRDDTRARQVEKDLGASWVPWDERTTLRPALWVQATPLGGRPDDMSPLPDDVLAQAAAVIELVYTAGPTRFEAAARRADLPVVTGQRFLIEQAIDAYRFWFDEDPDRHAMEAALR